eukprot:g18874.t1
MQWECEMAVLGATLVKTVAGAERRRAGQRVRLVQLECHPLAGAAGAEDEQRILCYTDLTRFLRWGTPRR